LMVALDAERSGWVAVAANLLLVQSFIGQPSLNFPAWSIPPELFLPAAGILMVPILRRRSTTNLVAGLAVLAAIEAAGFFLALRGGWFDADPSRIARAALGLAGGAMLYLVWDAFRPQGSAWITYASLAGILAVMALAGIIPVLVLLFPVLVSLMLAFGAGLAGVLSSRPVQAVGRWSYSIYLLHIPVLLVSERLFGQAGMQGAGPKLLLVLAVLASSAAMFRFVEEPFMRMGGGRINPPRSITATRP
jgi:peptidoglycan/LPS O-acetylase OafA/YrhL